MLEGDMRQVGTSLCGFLVWSEKVKTYGLLLTYCWFGGRRGWTFLVCL